jgi:Mn-containing catalase
MAALTQLATRLKSDTTRDPTTGTDLGAGPGAGRTKQLEPAE